MTSLVRIERADPDQAMHPALGLEVSVGIRTTDQQRDVFDARFFAGEIVHHGHIVSMPLAISPIHAQQDIGPVAGLRSACTRVKAQIGVAGIETAIQQRLNLERRKGFVYSIQNSGCFFKRGFFLCRIRLRFGQFVKDTALLHISFEALERVKNGANGICFCNNLPRLGLVVPEIRCGRLAFEFA